MTPSSNRSFFAQRHWLWWFMVLVFVLVLAARLRLLGFPLERDEGEYSYAGQLILQGIPPYDLAYNMKFPGTYLAYAVIMAIFGQTPAGIHLGMLVLTTGTALMLFWLGRKLLDDIGGIVAATTYMVLAASPSMLGLTGHATHFCAFFATAGLCLMWKARQKESLGLIAGFALCFGTAVLMKQHAAIIAAWAGLAYAVGKCCDRTTPLAVRLGKILFCAVAMLLPFGLCCLWLWHAGVFDKFWFWTIRYAKEYAAVVPISYAPQFFWHTFSFIAVKGILLWVIGFAGLIFVWVDERWRNQRAWMLGFCVASALAVCPDLYFRKHYFLIAMPAFALLAGATISGMQKLGAARSPIKAKAPAWIFAVAVALAMATFSDIWFFDSLPQILRGVSNTEFIDNSPFLRLFPESFAEKILVFVRSNTEHGLYGADPLPESEVVAKYIADNSPPDARVAILGSEPEIYFLSHRHSATGYIYTYAQMEPQPFALTMQHEMMSNIISNQPEFVVFADNIMSWNRRDDSNPTIFNWWDGYKTNYTLVGIADVISRTNTIYVFGTNYIARYPEAHGSALEIFQRK